MLGGRRAKRRNSKLRFVILAVEISRANALQGVYMGSGIGSLDDVYETTIAYEKGVSCDLIDKRASLTDKSRDTEKSRLYLYLAC
jgi:hypothetical protein